MKILNWMKKMIGMDRYEALAQRGNCLSQWLAEFPGKKEEVETFIGIIYDAFLVPGKYKYHVRPSDSIGFFYDMSRTSYCDNLEYEVFFDNIEYEFNLKLTEEQIRSETSFAEIFRLIKKE